MTRQTASSAQHTAARSRWPGRLVALLATTLLTALVTAVPAQAASYLVSGLVTFADGDVAEGASVTFTPQQNNGVQRKVTTDFEGRYETLVPAGNYRVTFTKGTAQGAWPSGVTVEDGEELVLTSARDDIDGVMRQGGTLKGSLKGADGSVPGERGFVTIYRISPDGTARRHAELRTSSLGAYTTQVTYGRYLLRFDAPGLATEFSGEAATYAASEPVDVGEVETVTVDATLEPGGTLEGQLFAPANERAGFGAAELLVEAYQEGPLGWEKTRYAAFDQRSEWFKVSGLNSATYRICWTNEQDAPDRDRFAAQCIGGTTQQDARDLAAVAGEARYVPKTTVRLSTIVTGQVTDAQGEPVGDVLVCLAGVTYGCSRSAYPLRGAVTDDDGRYTVRVPHDAPTFRLSFTPPPMKGVVKTWNGGATSETAASAIPVAANTTVTQDVQLVSDGQPTVAVAGTIRADDGTSLRWSSVTLRRLGEQPTTLGTVDSDATGSYAIRLAPGSYEITYAADGYKSRTQSLDVSAPRTKNAVLSRYLKAGTIKGRLTRDGAPLVDALVYADRYLDPARFEATTGADGVFLIRGLGSRSWDVWFDDPLSGERFRVGGVQTSLDGSTYPIAPFEAPPFVKAETRPTITAVPKVGRPVSVAAAQWNTDVALTYGWYAGSTKVASTLAYTPKAADVGKPLRLVVTATRGATEVSTTTLARVVRG